MGGLRKYMPITYITMVIGVAGAVRHSAVRRLLLEGRDHRGDAPVVDPRARVRVLLRDGRRVRHRVLHVPDDVHGVPRRRRASTRRRTASTPQRATTTHDEHHGGPPKESPWVVTVPLILLAIPSVFAGWVDIEPLLFGGYFGNSICRAARRTTCWQAEGGVARRGRVHRARRADRCRSGSPWPASRRPGLPVSRQPGAAGADRARRWGRVYTLLDQQLLLRQVQRLVLRRRRAPGRQRCSSNVGDGKIIEGVVNGSARMVGWWAAMLRQLQSGYVYHYAFTMIIGLFALLTWWVIR